MEACPAQAQPRPSCVTPSTSRCLYPGAVGTVHAEGCAHRAMRVKDYKNSQMALIIQHAGVWGQSVK